MPDAGSRSLAEEIWNGQDGDQQPIPMWLDDAFAILIAAQCPRINLLGISTVHGNASVAHTTHNTLAILTAIGRTDIPVYAGAARPDKRKEVHAESIHGDSGLDGTTLLPAPTTHAQPGSAVAALVSALLSTPPGSAWVVTTGALTNAAHAFAACPELAAHVRGVSIMGGALGRGFSDAVMGQLGGRMQSFGNWSPFAEFNCDPEAASSILTHPILRPKTTLIPLDLTHQVIADSHVLGHIRGPPADHAASRVRALFLEILTFFSRTYAHVFGMTMGPPLHDPIAVVAALAPGTFFDAHGCHSGEAADEERWAVRVCVDGDDTGGTGEKRQPQFSGQLGRTRERLLKKGSQGVRIPRRMDVDMLWWLVDFALERAGAQMASASD
ncbi:Inosine/uridine-preferring nucleoside hydrolase domain-containing protein [Lineolata rhizophorae]|uniref:Inosine/uridine-preferring nucleoside hydrolase domain-containing protein n=1 Tax=Lineolata rhizophorae TaxID=578093 RepID=A0A6A6NVR1_9PEZI|nr:Inosine/uridine-preferring nucleoside hydrolase domain-containing protein [Lineolata rhizophorae]